MNSRSSVACMRQEVRWRDYPGLFWVYNVGRNAAPCQNTPASDRAGTAGRCTAVKNRCPEDLSENTLPVGVDSKISTQIINVASPLPLCFHYRPKKKNPFLPWFWGSCLKCSFCVAAGQLSRCEEWASSKASISCQLRNTILWQLGMPQSAFGATFKPGVHSSPRSSAVHLMSRAQAGLPSPASCAAALGDPGESISQPLKGLQERAS